jgi:hypothetical protein
MPVTSNNQHVQQKECDYDINPTILYQAIEAKQWEYAISVYTKNQQEEQSSTWVVRKETNGKLRWRLLPLHAAVIFGSPLKLIELLLADYPHAAQCKDDQGMLPLHLAFRNESNWDVVDELLTAYPSAVFICDRKGRTPLQCGIRYANISSAGSVVTTATATSTRPGGGSGGNSTVGGGSTNNNNNKKAPMPSDSNHQKAVSHKPPIPSPSFRSIVSVIDLYSQIAVSGERKRTEQEIKTLANNSISQLKETHLKTLSALKKEWEIQQESTTKQMQQLRDENATLKQRIQELEQQHQQPNNDNNYNYNDDYNANDEVDAIRQQNSSSNNYNHHQRQQVVLQQEQTIDTMINEQIVYHTNVQNLLIRYQNIISEREQIRSILLKHSSDDDDDDDVEFLESFQRWYDEQDRKLQTLEEEKKVDDDHDNGSSSPR